MNQRAVTLEHWKTCHHLVAFGFQYKDAMQSERKTWGFKEMCSHTNGIRPFFLGLLRDRSSHFSVLWILSGKPWETQSQSTGYTCSGVNPGPWIQEAVHQVRVKMGLTITSLTNPPIFLLDLIGNLMSGQLGQGLASAQLSLPCLSAPGALLVCDLRWTSLLFTGDVAFM